MVDTESGGALAGLRILDVTQMLAGPLAATRLGDLGADVIKVEPPRKGEFNRTHGFGDARACGEMTTFLAVNRNKRSVAIDLKSDTGLQVMYDLVRTSDVMLQNFRYGTADRLGIGYRRLQSINPGLVYCSISGYGGRGPYRDRPGQDLVIQGYSGSMFSVGRESDLPLPGALWAADVMTGYQAVIGVLAALAERSRSGLGQHVEIDMLTVVLDAQLQELVTFLNTGSKPARGEEFTAHASIPAPYGVYRTRDGWLTLAMSPLPALGEVLDDDYLRTLLNYNDGVTHRDEVYSHIRDKFIGRSTQEWLELCDRAGVWAGPVYTYDDLLADPHIKATGMFVTQPQSQGRHALTVRPPLNMSRTAPQIRRGAPALGSDTGTLLSELGYTDEQIAMLSAKNAIQLGGKGAQ